MAQFDTENQVSGIVWNQEYREIITASGYPNSNLRLWKYPKFTHITVTFFIFYHPLKNL